MFMSRSSFRPSVFGVLQALCLLEDLRDLTEKEIKFRELSVRIGSSVGVASLTKPTEELAKFPKGTPVRGAHFL